jgi:hypothetical protein
MRLAILANLATFSTVVSQPLLYLVALSEAQRALSASAYIELRQRVNPVMSRRVPIIYGSAVATALLVLVLASHAGDRLVLGTTAVAFACLIADVVLMMRENLPINRVVDRWSATAHPPDWAAYRTRWFTIFGYRQTALLLGFASLLVGAVFR